ncbi:MAG: choice-of-anchor Q domain-containing protein [Phycisphaerales bacterium]
MRRSNSVVRASVVQAAIVAATASSMAVADTINVPADAPTITIAINLAAAGDEIVVAPGTYFEAVSLNGKTLTIRSSDGPATTIVDGFGQFKPVIRIVTGEGAATLIEGFTIRNGNATAAAPGDRGGGIYCNATSPTISNCIFQANQAVFGGGFYANGGAPKIIGCQFVENDAVTAVGDGGAAYLTATTAILTDCKFIGNSAQRIGGAIRSITSNSTHTRCEYIQNQSGNNGGALDVSGTTALTAIDCRFTGNASGALGGAVVSATTTVPAPAFINCVFDANTAATTGGAVHIATGAKAELTNCTVAGNMSVGAGGGIFSTGTGAATVRNCIVWGNVPTGIVGVNTTTYSCHQGVIAGTGNINADPLFIDEKNGDLRLSAGSPCIDAGNTTLLNSGVSIDLDGDPRVVNVLPAPTGVFAYGYFIDMGAYEFPAPATPTNCPGDFDGNGMVDGADLGLLLGAWGRCPEG